MADTTNSKSPLATQLPLSNIATQLLQLKTDSDSPAIQLALSTIAMQLVKLQIHYSEQEAEQQKKLSALEAKSKLQAREIGTFSSLVSSLMSELHVVRSKQERLQPTDPAGSKPVTNISSFQSLPYDIRRRIWRYTFPEPRIVQLFGTERILGLAGKTPIAMHICHDSRQEARSVYREINMKQVPGGLDFEHDILYVSTAVKYYSPAGLLSDIARWFELKDIRHIAFQYELWKIMCDEKEAFNGFLEKLKGLQELIIVIDDEVPATPARRKRHVEFIHCGNSVREVIVGMVSRTLLDFGKNSLLAKIRYRKALRQPVPTFPSKTTRGIDSKFTKQAATPGSSSDPSESPTPQSGSETSYPQHPPPSAKDTFLISLGSLPGTSFSKHE
ncbi:hypothetical protein VE01_07187 [Pseudogymnoascus verrucosus]|uniref:2EXR domain-containing protein n=1 Tax=Pseudogymnoascus verrucosus TaxID=342668 RepID=A0A1B8GF31_9PEZI|nr:uncharacterized protein VE01_07187 [Pseudogymnoascus verrucosus]OBT94435.1 hypothetical protein VE01_07187 [Pseudogymnoascus verrucosus]